MQDVCHEATDPYHAVRSSLSWAPLCGQMDNPARLLSGVWRMAYRRCSLALAGAC